MKAERKKNLNGRPCEFCGRAMSVHSEETVCIDCDRAWAADIAREDAERDKAWAARWKCHSCKAGLTRDRARWCHDCLPNECRPTDDYANCSVTGFPALARELSARG